MLRFLNVTITPLTRPIVINTSHNKKAIKLTAIDVHADPMITIELAVLFPKN